MNSEKKSMDFYDSNSLLENEAAVPFSPEDYKAFFKVIGKEVIFSSTDAEGNIIYANDKFLEITKYSLEELIGKNQRILKSGYHSVEFYSLLWKTISSGGVWRGEIKNIAKDGSFYWVETSIIPIVDVPGKPEKYVSIQFLITEQKTPESMEYASHYVRSLIEASLDPLVTINLDGKITDVNEASMKITGKQRNELIGTDFINYFTETEKAKEGYQEAFAKGSIADYPLTIRHEDGHLTDVLYNASVYKDVKGQVLGVVAAARDITAQKRVEKELAEQRHKELQRLAELEKFQKITIGRELRMIELKSEIEELKSENAALKFKSS